MYIHYIILAHSNPLLLSRLISNLSSTNAIFYIHLDKKSNISPFISELESKNLDVTWITPRYRIKWGHLDIVRATLQAFKAIKPNSENDRIVLLSGQDFPIKPVKYIEDFFSKNSEKIFIEGEAFPTKTWGERSFDRINNYHIFTPRRGWIYSLPHISNLNDWRSLHSTKKKWAALFFLKVMKKREFPSYVKPYGGSQWFSINGYALKYVLKFLDEQPGYLTYHRDTLIPDEIFFQSIIYSSGDPKIKSNIVNSNHHYIDWTIREGKNPPAILDLSDFRQIADSDKLFCRKVEQNISDSLLGRIEVEMLHFKS
jgi:hypothetical protein